GSIQAVHEGDYLAADIGVEDGQLPLGRLPEAYAPGEPVDGERLGAEELRKGAAHETEAQLELKRPVLGLTKAEPKPGVRFVLPLDVRNTEPIASDCYRSAQSGQRQRPTQDRQAC